MLRTPIEFVARENALAPAAVVAEGAVAHALASRLLAMREEARAQLRGVSTPDMLVVLGASGALPWVDGVVYLGREEHAPRVLVPTTQRAIVAAELVQRALLAQALRQSAQHAGPWAVLLAPWRLVSLAEARTLDATRLQAWLEAYDAPHTEPRP